MFRDDEFEAMVTTSKRVQSLGFKPQKENLINHLLPYARELDAESTHFLEQVKTNLAKSVMLREMKPACGVWSARLMKYIRLHGLKIGKEDHIALIKLMYELVVIPELEPCKVHKFITIFMMLIKIKEAVSPEDLTLPWRPLYEVGKRMYETNAARSGLFHYIGSVDAAYITMVKHAKFYFDVNATKEILDEFSPKIFPWSPNTNTLNLLMAFLPVSLAPEHAARGYELWLNNMIDLWDICHNSSSGITDMVMLFAELAKHNPGAVDWNPYIIKLFPRVLQSLNLPVTYKDIQLSKLHPYDMKFVSMLIVWSIKPDGEVLKHLRSFIAAIESYLHSANNGHWSHKLKYLLRKISREFLNRVNKEHDKSPKLLSSWENKSPDSFKLREEDITEFVTIVLEPTLQCVYSRCPADMSLPLQQLAALRPAIVIPPLLEKLKTSLTSLTEPHRVTASMSAVGAVARSMVRGARFNYPEGPTHVVPFLMAVLPGLDPNDTKKTVVTLQFILGFSYLVPFIDCSSAHEYWPDLTEEELLTCESTAQFEDFILVFLDRLFVIIESSVTEHVRLDSKESHFTKSKSDGIMETTLATATTSVLMQSSPKIFKEALRKFTKFATESNFENVSASLVGVMLRIFARVDSESTLAIFVPKLCDELNELLSTDDALRDENPSIELLYRLVLLSHVVECDGSVLLKYIPHLLPVLDRALKLHSYYALCRACDILGNILTSLNCIDLKEFRSSSKDYSEAPEKWLPIREWGRGCMMQDANFQWHVPSTEEAECAQMLIDRYLKQEMARLQEWITEARATCRDRISRSLQIIYAATSCLNFYPLPKEKSHLLLVKSQIPATKIRLANGVKHTVTLNGENMRVALANFLEKLQAHMLANASDDTRSFEILIQLWDRVVALKASRPCRLEARIRAVGALEKVLDYRGAGDITDTTRLRVMLAEAAIVQEDLRPDFIGEATATPTIYKAFYGLYELCFNSYSTVRAHAQARLHVVLNTFPYSSRLLAPKLAKLLEDGGEGEEWHTRHKATLYMILGSRVTPLIAKQDWHVVATLWPAILKAPLSEKPSILRLEYSFGECIHRYFPTVNTRLTITQAAVDAASYFVTEKHRDAQFVKLLDEAVANEIANSDATEKAYTDLMEELVDIADQPNIQWRRLELAMQMLLQGWSAHTKVTPKVVKFVVSSLIHDNILVRNTATRLMSFVLKQRKRPLKKISVDPYEIANVPKPEKHVPGYRKDLEWVLWSEDRIPKTDEDWDKPWLRRTFFGFYAWPEKIVVAAPMSEQRFAHNMPPEEMEEGERYIFDFFNDNDNVEKLVRYLTVEEKKKDKFNMMRCVLFRYVFAHFGERIANKFIEHAVRCAGESLEAPQRFAAEVAAAAIRGTRYWRRQPAQDMLKSAMNIYNIGLTTVLPETMEDWAHAIAYSVDLMDPNRIGEVVRGMVRLCAPAADAHAHADQKGSFLICARLFSLQALLMTMRYRVAPLAVEILQRLEETNFINHPYQNVRESVASMLMSIFDNELVFPGGNSGPAPRLGDFLNSVFPRLAPLYDENGDISEYSFYR
ncbi:hypothetical protein ACJJTC_013268 [Scirpophaga incertulas]